MHLTSRWGGGGNLNRLKSPVADLTRVLFPMGLIRPEYFFLWGDLTGDELIKGQIVYDS